EENGGDQITESSVSSIQAASIWETTPLFACLQLFFLLVAIKSSLPYTVIVFGKFNLRVRKPSRCALSGMRLPVLFHFIESQLPPRTYGTLLCISQCELMENLDT
ncbi:hypothetical protein, partial [Aeromonas allosaccharophila]|uniref:hypothetical protein n=1 Tax=Aeromonas allosaccharophila TaxID=656 RepID=UPI003D1F554E